MNFNQAIPLQLRPKFSEGSALASERDSRSNAQSWKKARSISRQENSNGIAIQKLTREVAKMRRRIVGCSSSAGPDVNFFHPFKIYNVPTEFCPPIDVPNNYNPITDSWRTFRVRAGIVGFRSTNETYQPDGGNAYYAGLSGPEFYFSASHPVGLGLLSGTDGASRYDPLYTGRNFPYDEDTFDSIDLETVYLDNTGDFTPTTKTNAVFVLKGDPDDNHAVMASFWIEITDVVILTPPVATVKCRMITAQTGDSTGRTNQWFPDASSKTIIPIGIICPKEGYFPWNETEGKDLYCEQILSGNAVNRYSQGYQGSVGGSMGMMAYRGNWDTDTLTNQYFYPGDATMAGNRMYVHNGYGQETSAPTGDGTPNWTWLNINGS